MKKAYIFAGVDGPPAFAASTAECRFFEPTGGVQGTHKPGGFFFCGLQLSRAGMVILLSVPVTNGNIKPVKSWRRVLNLRDLPAMSRNYTIRILQTLQLWSGELVSLWGAGGLTCFADPLPSVS